MVEAAEGAAAVEPDAWRNFGGDADGGASMAQFGDSPLATRRAVASKFSTRCKCPSLTQPREFETMVARSLFLLRLWEVLPSDEQRFAVDQLVELNGRFNAAQIATIASDHRAKAGGDRQALKQQFSARGAQDQAWLRALGL